LAKRGPGNRHHVRFFEEPQGKRVQIGTAIDAGRTRRILPMSAPTTCPRCASGHQTNAHDGRGGRHGTFVDSPSRRRRRLRRPSARSSATQMIIASWTFVACTHTARRRPA
jgi:hypothetical protein